MQAIRLNAQATYVLRDSPGSSKEDIERPLPTIPLVYGWTLVISVSMSCDPTHIRSLAMKQVRLVTSAARVSWPTS
jgi:hypothetical protein